MKIGNVIVILNGDVESNSVIVGTDSGIVQDRSKYGGRRLTDAVEEEFYARCRKINPALPEDPDEMNPNDWPENLDFDEGTYQFGDYLVYMLIAHTA